MRVNSMAEDFEHLRQYYASLSDQGLRDIRPGDLTDAGRACYNAEVVERFGRAGLAPKPRTIAVPKDPPDWLDTAAEVYSEAAIGDASRALGAAEVGEILHAAGIPCRVTAREIPPEEPGVGRVVTHEWVVLVPGQRNLEAASILDRDLFNEQFEAEWRTHLEELGDSAVVAMRPEVVFCGLFDRVERVERVWREELERRGIDPVKPPQMPSDAL